MDGTTFTRVTDALGQMVIRPRDGVRWWWSFLRRRSPLDMGVPWTSYGAIDYLRTQVPPGAKVFEWGGGGSTRFFVRMGCQVTTVESSAQWARDIENAIRGETGLGSLAIRHIHAETKDPKAVSEYVGAIREGAPWDIVLVDGLEEEFISRIDCVRELPGQVGPGGMVILDDAWRKEYARVPAMLDGWRRLSFRGLGFARLGVTQTDVYIAPS